MSTTTMRANTDRCPIGHCPVHVTDEQLMCPRHWRLVPPALKRAVHRAWQHGAGAGSEAHQHALSACVEAVEASCQPASDHNLRASVRTFLARYRHPNAINGESWDEEDVTHVISVMRCHPHKPDPRTRRCQRCGAAVAPAAVPHGHEFRPTS